MHGLLARLRRIRKGTLSPRKTVAALGLIPVVFAAVMIFSTAVLAATAPDAPTSVSATPGNAQATVSWSAPGSDGGSAITSYTVTPYIGATAGTAVTVTAPTTVSTLINGTSYTFRITATNAIGTGPAATTPAITVGAPTAPGSVSATAGANQAQITWTASTANGSAITGYLISAYSGSTPVNSVGVGATAVSATISGLKNSAYTFAVAANSAVGYGPSGASSAVTPTGASSTYASTVIADAPSVFWRLGDPTGTLAADSSGNSQVGTYTGTTTLGVGGLIPNDGDPALGVAGAGYVVGASVAAVQGSHDRSVELWFSTTSTASQALFDSGSTGNDNDLEIFLVQGGLGLTASDNAPGIYAVYGNDNYFVAAPRISDGTPHHVVLTLSGLSVYVWIDGQASAGYRYHNGWGARTAQPFTNFNAQSTAANPIWLGHARQTAGANANAWFNGTIDELAIYPIALLTGPRLVVHPL